MTRGATILVALVLAACGTGSPSSTPGGFADLIAQLVLRGVTVHEHVSGDAGCPDSDLHSNALRLTVTAPDETARRDIHLFRWRRQSDFDAAGPAYDACLKAFARTHPGAPPASLEVSPWRALGTGWQPGLASTVEEALRAAAGN